MHLLMVSGPLLKSQSPSQGQQLVREAYLMDGRVYGRSDGVDCLLDRGG